VLKIGVLLPARFSEAGDYLADARALDAAGVDSLWLRDDDFDPWLVLAGIAAVTGRARLAVSVSGRDAAPAAALARRLATLDRLSRGRVLVTVVPADGPGETEALIGRARESCPGSLLLHANGGSHTMVGARLADGLVAAAEPAACHATFDQARERRARDHLKTPFELWTRMAPPTGREQWRGALAAAGAVGATGILVPADPRLLDLLRNGDAEDDRSDLTLAQG
jgi:hypothetical protein